MAQSESPAVEPDSSPSSAVLHVLVIGFHHKKGCQLEYSHPPLMPDGDAHSSELPSQWKHLPALALPDGSHNFSADTVYFHMPALDNPRKTVFGISCYRQIDADKLVNKTADITRGTVQKSVCVLSRLPLYGQIQVKMSLITEAYFAEGDFTRVDLIHETYDNLNACLTDDMLHTQQLYVGLSARAFVHKCRQRALMLFKLLLLERKVLFMQSPVNELCSFFLTLLSLHPGMLEGGLDEAARMVPADTPPSSSPCEEERPVEGDYLKNEAEIEKAEEASEVDNDDTGSIASNAGSIAEMAGEKLGNINRKLSGALGYIAGYSEGQQKSDVPEGTEAAIQIAPNFATIAGMNSQDFGLPLNIFTGGNLCHPYLSLSYLDVLSQPSIHGYMMGATNILFRQKKGISEIVIDIEADRYEVHDQELKRALHLTTEDLRFVDNVIKHVSEESSDAFLDGVGWEGGDEWVRAQFRFYLVCLLRTSLEPTSAPEANLFNSSFMNLWRRTKNYQFWRGNEAMCKSVAEEVPLGHPFSGHLSMDDMKLHLSNTISNTEGGKKVSAAVSNTGRVVAGGLSSAKGAISSLWSSFRQPKDEEEEKGTVTGVEDKDKDKTESSS
jgi:hypothetical protein